MAEPWRSMRQVVTLGNLVGRVERLEICCTRCPRRGRVMLDKLIAEHGAGMDLPQLGTVLATDCPKAQATRPRFQKAWPIAASRGRLARRYTDL